MPDKDGADDKKKMKNEEVVDYLKDTGRYKRSPDTKDATSYPPSEEVKKTQKINTGPSAYELIKKKYEGQIMNVGKKGKKKVQDEFDLTKVAEALGGYIVEAEAKSGGKSKGESKKDKEDAEKAAEMSKKRGEFAKSFGKDPTQASDAQQAALGDRVGKADATKDYERVASEIEKPGEGQIKGRERLGDTTKTIGGIRTSKVGEKQPEGIVARTRRLKAQADKKQSISDTLRKAKQTDIKGGSSVKRGDPVPQEEIPTKKKPVPEIGGFQFNTFKPEIMARRKTFKQGFGQKTGADPVTGKPTYMRPGVLDKDGKPRKAQKRSKLLPDYEQTKRTIGMGLNPDETDKNKFIKTGVRDDRTDDLGTPDPFDPDYDKKVKKVDGRTKIGRKIKKAFTPPKFQTRQRPMEVDKETQPDTEKMGGQLVKSKKSFKDFNRIMRDAKVDADIERTIAGSGGGRKTKIGTGTALDPEVVKNGRAKNAIDVTNVKLPSKFSQAKDKIGNFAKTNPVAALATYDLGKGVLGKISKLRMPGLRGGTVGRRSAGTFTAT